MVDGCAVVRAMVRRQDEGDLDGYAAGFAPDGVFHHPAATVRGRAEIRAFLETYEAAFPGARHEITAIIERDGVVAMEGTYEGVHSGPLATPAGDVPATGRTVTLRWAGFARLQDGLVVSLHGYYDQFAFLDQLGLLPAPAPV